MYEDFKSDISAARYHAPSAGANPYYASPSFLGSQVTIYAHWFPPEMSIDAEATTNLICALCYILRRIDKKNTAQILSDLLECIHNGAVSDDFLHTPIDTMKALAMELSIKSTEVGGATSAARGI